MIRHYLEMVWKGKVVVYLRFHLNSRLKEMRRIIKYISGMIDGVSTGIGTTHITNKSHTPSFIYLLGSS
jgi:hypothetical protein